MTQNTVRPDGTSYTFVWFFTVATSRDVSERERLRLWRYRCVRTLVDARTVWAKYIRKDNNPTESEMRRFATWILIVMGKSKRKRNTPQSTRDELAQWKALLDEVLESLQPYEAAA